MENSIDIVRRAANASTIFELTNTDIKRQYIISNIMIYNAIVSSIKESKGTFGTGYPFYVLDNRLQGALPVIDEQLRYNNALIADAEGKTNWLCEMCLSQRGFEMPNLKEFCNVCPDVEKVLRPRKVINRLPDLDLWTICSPEEIGSVSVQLAELLKMKGFSTSDVDPVKTIYEIESLVLKIKGGELPDEHLPIDTHIIDNVTLYTLIAEIPDVLKRALAKEETPYAAISPLSLRKSWQHDDMPYNFVHDFLSSFHEFRLDDDMQKLLDETRLYVAKHYSFDQLYKWLLESGGDSVKRRHQTPGLKESFKRRVDSWNELG